MKTTSVVGMLMAGFPTRLRWLVGTLCGITGLPAVWIVLYGTQPGRETGAAVIFSVDIWMAWCLFATGSSALLGDAKVLRIPGVARAWSATTLLFLLPSVLLPAVFFGVCSGDFGEILPGFLCAAAAGMLLVAPLDLMALHPRLSMCFWIVCLALMNLNGYLPKAALSRVLHAHPMPTGSTALWALLALLCGLMYWRWQTILGADGRLPTWKETLAAGRAGGSPVVESGRIAGAGQDGRVVAMRYLLGGLVAPRRWQQLAANVLGLVVFSALAVLSLHIAIAALFVPFAFSVIPLLQYPQPWGKRYAMQGGDIADMAELALLPGWGDRKTTQRTLLLAVFRPLATYLVIAVVAIEILGYILHVGSTLQWSLACSLVIAGSAAVVNCLDVLAHRPPAFLFNVYFFCVAVALIVVTLYSCIGIGSHWIDLSTWFGLTAIHCCAMVLLARSPYADFRRQPHPFLMP